MQERLHLQQRLLYVSQQEARLQNAHQGEFLAYTPLQRRLQLLFDVICWTPDFCAMPAPATRASSTAGHEVSKNALRRALSASRTLPFSLAMKHRPLGGVGFRPQLHRLRKLLTMFCNGLSTRAFVVSE